MNQYHDIIIVPTLLHMCMDKWCSLTASTLCLLSLSCKKVQKVSHRYAQNESQMDHPQRMSWLLVAISSTTNFEHSKFCITVLSWLKKVRKKISEFLLFQVGHFRAVFIHHHCCLKMLIGATSRDGTKHFWKSLSCFFQGQRLIMAMKIKAI